MNDFFGKIKSGAGKMTFEADKMGRLNRAKSDLDKIKNQIQAEYLKLGEMYFKQRGTTGVTGQAYDEICQAIVELEHQFESKNEDIQRINAEIYTPQAIQPLPQPVSEPAQSPSTPTPTQPTPPSAPAPDTATTKFCPNCGKEMPVAVKFCPDCGTKV